MTDVDQANIEELMSRCCVRAALRDSEAPPSPSTQYHPAVKKSNCAAAADSRTASLDQGAQKSDKTSDKTACTSSNSNNKNHSNCNDNNHKSSSDMSADSMEVLIKRVPDGEGVPITLGWLYGVWTAPLPSLPEQISRAQQFVFDDSDVILLGYAKSGTHWLWEILHMLMKNKAEHCQTPKERLMLSFSTQEFFDTIEAPRVFNSHAPFGGLPSALRGGRNRCRIVYLLRNPKDLAVSYYHHLKAAKEFEYEGSFSGFLQLFIEGKVPGGSWFDYVLGWEQTLRNNQQLPVLTIHYEDLKEDMPRELRKISSFLNIERSHKLYEAIASECCISRMREVDESLKQQFPVNISKTGKNFIYRKGIVGDWKNWFSVADNDKFDRVIAQKLINSQLRFRYEIDASPELPLPQTDPDFQHQ